MEVIKVFICLGSVLSAVVPAQQSEDYRRWMCSGPMTSYTGAECEDLGDQVGVYDRGLFNTYGCCNDICDGVIEGTIDEERCQSYLNCKTYQQQECSLDVPTSPPPQVPEADPPQVPEADPPQVPEADPPQVPEADPPQVPEADPSQVPDDDSEPAAPNSAETSHGNGVTMSSWGIVTIVIVTGISLPAGIVSAVIITRKRMAHNRSAPQNPNEMELGEMNGDTVVEPNNTVPVGYCGAVDHTGGAEGGTCSRCVQDTHDTDKLLTSEEQQCTEDLPLPETESSSSSDLD